MDKGEVSTNSKRKSNTQKRRNAIMVFDFGAKWGEQVDPKECNYLLAMSGIVFEPKRGKKIEVCLFVVIFVKEGTMHSEVR